MTEPETIETVPCAICGTQTDYVHTKRCSRCWELETRIEADPDLTLKILARLLKGEPRP